VADITYRSGVVRLHIDLLANSTPASTKAAPAPRTAMAATPK
jgi:hypothetical protein